MSGRPVAIAAAAVIGLTALARQQPLLPADDGARFIIEREGKYGFANREGTVVIPPRFEHAAKFSEGLAAVQVGRLWGYIDVEGRQVIGERFQKVRIFHEGVAAVSQDGDTYRFIDVHGDWAMPSDSGPYEDATSFSQGYAAVKVHGGWGFIDYQGRIVVTPRFEEVGVFGDGLVPVRVSPDNWEYIDVTGNTRISGPFWSAGSFSDGIAAARRARTFAPCQYLNTKGEVAIDQKFTDAGVFGDGLAPVRLQTQPFDEPFSYIDRTGAVRIRGPFEYAGEFVNGLAEITDGVFHRSAYIDRSGHRVFFQSDRARPISRVSVSVDSTGRPTSSALVSVELKSNPPGASVFMIPLREWEKNPGLRQDETALSNYQVPSGRTNTLTEVMDKVYILLFTLAGHAPQTVKLDVRKGIANVADVQFK